MSAAARWKEALALRPGVLWLLGARLVVAGMAGLPVLAVAWFGITRTQGTSPYLVEQGRTAPVAFEVLETVGAPVAAAMIAGVALFVLLDQLLLASAVQWVAPDVQAHRAARRSAWTLLWYGGLPYLWRFLRVAGVAALAHAAGGLAVQLAVTALDRLGMQAGWSGLTRMVLLPGAGAGTLAIWGACVGALAFWSRVLLVAEDGLPVRRALVRALKVFRRAPLGSIVVYAAVTLGVQAAGAGLLALQGLAGGGVHFVLAWGTWLAAQTYAWYALVHAARLKHARLQHPRLASPARLARRAR